MLYICVCFMCMVVLYICVCGYVLCKYIYIVCYVYVCIHVCKCICAFECMECYVHLGVCIAVHLSTPLILCKDNICLI